MPAPSKFSELFSERKRSEDLGEVIYLVGDTLGNLKIGYSSGGEGGARERVKSLQSGCAYLLSLLACVAGSREEERDIHTRLAEFWTGGGTEWFRPDESACVFIRERFNIYTLDCPDPDPDLQGHRFSIAFAGRLRDRVKKELAVERRLESRRIKNLRSRIRDFDRAVEYRAIELARERKKEVIAEAVKTIRETLEDSFVLLETGRHPAVERLLRAFEHAA